MNEKQLALIMKICEEQISDCLTEELTREICAGIREGLEDNVELMAGLGTGSAAEKNEGAHSFLLIAGSRDYTDYEEFETVVRENMPAGDPVIIEGGAQGVDTMAREFAVSEGLFYKEFTAKWEIYGRAAGPKRNDEMTKYTAEHKGRALFFWDGQSKGTKQCIKSAMKAGIPLRVWNTAESCYMDMEKKGA